MAIRIALAQAWTVIPKAVERANEAMQLAFAMIAKILVGAFNMNRLLTFNRNQ